MILDTLDPLTQSVSIHSLVLVVSDRIGMQFNTFAIRVCRPRKRTLSAHGRTIQIQYACNFGSHYELISLSMSYRI